VSHRTLSQRAPARSEARSARRFVQGFYDWYTKESNRVEGKLDVRTDIVALKKRPTDFTPTLRRALLADRQTELRHPGQFESLDFDPFFNGQDLASKCSVIDVKREGKHWLIRVKCYYPGTKSTSEASAEVEKGGRTWHFANFLYESDNLLHILGVPVSSGKPSVHQRDRQNN
jgi:hypothetical protein